MLILSFPVRTSKSGTDENGERRPNHSNESREEPRVTGPDKGSKYVRLLILQVFCVCRHSLCLLVLTRRLRLMDLLRIAGIDRTRLGWGFARLVLPEDITWLWPWCIGDVPKDIYHSDPSF